MNSPTLHPAIATCVIRDGAIVHEAPSCEAANRLAAAASAVDCWREYCCCQRWTYGNMTGWKIVQRWRGGKRRTAARKRGAAAKGAAA